MGTNQAHSGVYVYQRFPALVLLQKLFHKMLRGHGESDVLPPGIGQNGFLLHYPLVSELLAANRAEPALAAEADFLLV